MIYVLLIIIFFLLIVCCYGWFYFQKAHFSYNMIKNYDQIIEDKKKEIDTLSDQLTNRVEFIEFQNQQSDTVALQIRELENEKQQIHLKKVLEEQQLEAYRKDVLNHKASIEGIIQDISLKYVEIKKSLIQEIAKYEQKIKAYIESEKRKEEMQTKIEFYKLQLTEAEKVDVLKLLNLCSSLSNPDILKKLVYKTYFEKQMNDLLGRVVGANSEITGIYKITHIETGKSYIGQTVNIKDRWRTHLKRGLGIDAPSSNKFYQSMYELKPWSFTWEVLETCKKEELNEKEKYWIDFHQTNSWGWNSKGGNK